jgi:heptaprenyl diphosphate synthase
MRKKVAYLGVFLALALVFSYVESLIPFYFGVPGIKLGLANIVMVILLYCMGAKEAFGVSVARVLLAGFLFGNLYSILYSLAGALLSLAVMYLLKKTAKFHILSVSAVGGVCHNIGQLIVAIITVENYRIAFYFPVLLIAGIVTGILIGIVAQEIVLRIRKFFEE